MLYFFNKFFKQLIIIILLAIPTNYYIILVVFYVFMNFYDLSDKFYTKIFALYPSLRLQNLLI
jgi:hypothetical protein